MKSNLITILVIAVIIAGAAWFAWQAQNQGENAGNSDAARVLGGAEDSGRTPYTDLAGNPIDLESYAGQVRVVNSWATWCPFCVEELVDFETLASELEEGEGVVIAINRGEPAAKQQAFLNQLGEFEHIIFVKDEADLFYESIGGFSMPETIYYDESGSVSTHKRGFMAIEEMRNLFQTALTATAN